MKLWDNFETTLGNLETTLRQPKETWRQPWDNLETAVCTPMLCGQHVWSVIMFAIIDAIYIYMLICGLTTTILGLVLTGSVRKWLGKISGPIKGYPWRHKYSELVVIIKLTTGKKFQSTKGKCKFALFSWGRFMIVSLGFHWNATIMEKRC